MLRLLPVLGLLLTAAPACAAEWTIDPAASTLAFIGTASGSPFTGKFARFSGTISFDPAQPQAGRADVVIDMASATTGDTQRDESLPQPDWFDTAHFPQAHFVASSFRSTGPGAYQAVGKLTIRDVTQAVALPFTLTITGDAAHAKGHLDLVRTQFGVGQGSWRSPDMVALEVAVDLDVTARRSKG